MKKFKVEPKSASNIQKLLVNSHLQDTNNPAYQAIKSLIDLFGTYVQTNNQAVAIMQEEIANLDTSKDPEIPGFFFMGSS